MAGSAVGHGSRNLTLSNNSVHSLAVLLQEAADFLTNSLRFALRSWSSLSGPCLARGSVAIGAKELLTFGILFEDVKSYIIMRRLDKTLSESARRSCGPDNML